MSNLANVMRIWRTDWKLASAVCFNLAVGLSSVIAAFAMVDGLFLRPLPIRDPAAFVHVVSSVPRGTTSHPQYDDLNVGSQTLSGLAAYSKQLGVRAIVEGVSSVRNGLVVSENYFEILGVSASVGRVFESGDAKGERKIVLSPKMWRWLSQSSAGEIGKAIYINQTPYVVIGVVADGFQGAERQFIPDYWILRNQMDPQWPLRQRNLHAVSLIGRLNPGVAKKTAEDELNRATAHLRKTHPYTDASLSMRVLSDVDWNITQNRSLAVQHIAILILSIMLLAISMFNAKSLLIARMESQAQEIAIRLAIGANRRSIIGAFVVQTASLAMIAGVLGCVFAFGILSLLDRQVLDAEMSFGKYMLSTRTVLLVVLASGLTGIISGVAPALSALNMDLPTRLKGRSSSRKDSPLGKLMCIAQLGLSLLLLVIAGLMAKSLGNAWAINPGYDGKTLLLAKIDFRHHAKLDAGKRLAIYRALRDALGSLPGVVEVSWGNMLPMNGAGWTNVAANGNEPATAADACRVDWLRVGPDYFKMLGVHIIEGREFGYPDFGKKFEEADIIVNRAFVDRFWPGGNPVGREFHPWGKSMPKQRIIGVVENFKTDLFPTVKPQLFTPAQDDTAVFFIHCERDPSYLKSSVRTTIDKVLPQVPLLLLSSYKEQIDESFAELRVGAIVTGIIGSIGAMLTGFGVFGFMFRWVTQHRREIAIRIAIGASKRAVLKHLFAKAFRMVAIGIGVGLVGSIFGGRYVSDALYEVAAWDAYVMLFAAVSLTAIAALAICAPAWSASRTSPLIALKSE